MQPEQEIKSELPAETRKDPLLCPSEVAKLFRVSTKTVVRWATAGKLPCVMTPGGHHRFRQSVVLYAMLTGQNAEGKQHS